MRHFAFLDTSRTAEIFHRPPEEVPADADRRLVATALGATLYAPGTRRALADDVRRQAARGVTSMVLCLEDAISDGQVRQAEDNVVATLRNLAGAPPPPPGGPPLVFVRVREVDQLERVIRRVGEGGRASLAGFVLPKFGEDNGEEWLAAVVRAGERIGRPLWAMPVLESPEIIFRELRLGALTGVRRLLDKHAETVLAVRIGATDLSGLFGLRRDRDLTIYDIAVVRECIADVVNLCARGGDHVVTGPVWEYFASPERLFHSSLRVSPFEQFDGLHGAELRARLVSRDLDRLMREVVLDKANGLLGKTVIHPSHVPAVHVLHVVTHEEYDDAITVHGATEGGVLTSSYANKMNELRPHRIWAEGVLRRARVFGVLRAGRTFVDLLGVHR